MVKKNCDSDLAQLSNSQFEQFYRTLAVVIQSYDAVDDKYKNVEFLTVKTIKSSDKMLSEIKNIASKANHDDKIMDVILHTSEQLTKNLLEKLIKECKKSKRFKHNLHNVQLMITRSVTAVNRNLASNLNGILRVPIIRFTLSSLDDVLKTTSTKKSNVAWVVSQQDNSVTRELSDWVTSNELSLAVLNGQDMVPSGIDILYAYVTNNHEGEELIAMLKDNNFIGNLILVDCINAFGASNRATVAKMVVDDFLEEATVLQPGCKYNLSEKEKQGLNQDKHEQSLVGLVTNYQDQDWAFIFSWQQHIRGTLL
jgi:hypothetical protein